MRRFTTSAATERSVLALLLVVELIVAAVIVGRAYETAARETAPVSTPGAASASDERAGSSTITLRDGRTVEFTMLGARGEALAARITAELDGAAEAVTAFWGDDWPRRVTIVLAGTDAQFTTLAGGAPDIAATTTAERIVFSPGAADISAATLRIVVRHELFHYAVRSVTAADAPRWLTEGVADYVGRPQTPVPGQARAGELAVLPTDDDLDAPGARRSLAYDRAWWFSRFVADRYGPATLRELYLAACGIGHPDAGTAISTVLGDDAAEVLTAWRTWLAG